MSPHSHIDRDSGLADRLRRLPPRRGACVGMGEEGEEGEEEEEEEQAQGCQCLGQGKVPGLGDHWPAGVLV